MRQSPLKSSTFKDTQEFTHRHSRPKAFSLISSAYDKQSDCAMVKIKSVQREILPEPLVWDELRGWWFRVSEHSAVGTRVLISWTQVVSSPCGLWWYTSTFLQRLCLDTLWTCHSRLKTPVCLHGTNPLVTTATAYIFWYFVINTPSQAQILLW